MLIAAVMVLAAATAMPADKTVPVETLFREFGLLGTWASHCTQAASPGNPHVSITTPGAGAVLEEHDLGSGYAINRYSMLSGERLSDELLSVKTIFQPGTAGEERERLVFRVRERDAAHDVQSAGGRQGARYGRHRAGGRQQDAGAEEVRLIYRAVSVGSVPADFTRAPFRR